MPKRKRLVDKLDSTDVIAILIIAGGFALMAFHINTVVGGIVTMVSGFYFGSKVKK